jgi:hypothetical protein
MSSFGHRRAPRFALTRAAMLMLAAPAAAQLVGIAAAVRNQASVKTARDAAPRPIRLKEGISLGDESPPAERALSSFCCATTPSSPSAAMRGSRSTGSSTIPIAIHRPSRSAW